MNGRDELYGLRRLLAVLNSDAERVPLLGRRIRELKLFFILTGVAKFQF